MGTNCEAEKIAQCLISISILIALHAIFVLVADTCCDSLKKVKSDRDNFLHEFQLAIGTPGTRSDRVSMQHSFVLPSTLNSIHFLLIHSFFAFCSHLVGSLQKYIYLFFAIFERSQTSLSFRFRFRFFLHVSLHQLNCSIVFCAMTCRNTKDIVPK